MFAICHDWQWTGDRRMSGNYIRLGVTDPLDEYQLINDIFNIEISNIIEKTLYLIK